MVLCCFEKFEGRNFCLSSRLKLLLQHQNCSYLNIKIIFSKYLKSSIYNSGGLNLEQSNTYPSQWVIHLYIRPNLISVVSKEPFDVSLITIMGPLSVRVPKLHPLF